MTPRERVVTRFVSRGGFSGRTESIGGAPSLPSPAEIAALASSLAEAASIDRVAFGTIDTLGSADDIAGHLTDAVAEIRKSGVDATLSESQQSALEAIVMLSGRPALFVKRDTFALPDGDWELLAPFRPSISRSLQSVGRIGVSAKYGVPYAGTGFVVAPGLVMTNRHVVENYVAGAGASWTLDPGAGMVIDFKQEFGVADQLSFAVTGVEWVDNRDDVDLALLRVESVTTAGGARMPLPAPLRLQQDGGYANTGNNVYVVGYPAADPRRNDNEQMHRVFYGVYEKKRIAPGRVASIDTVHGLLTHDCSTLGGNSGSCVVDLSTNSVIGLHFAGDYLEENFAVLLPALSADARFASLNWQEGPGD